MERHGDNTNCVHGGEFIDPDSNGLITPIYMSTASAYPNDANEIYYPRYNTITNQRVVAKKIAILEQTEDALIFASGMAAISTAMYGFLKAGDHAVFSQDIYGGTYKFVVEFFAQHNFTYTLVAGSDPEDFEKAIKPNTRFIYVETPSNPLLSVIDLVEIAKIAKKHNIISMIDNTFASPVNQKPYILGIDIVIHSGTKYLNGHSDLSIGIVTSSAEHIKTIGNIALLHGGCASPLDCFLLERGLKTLGLRVKQQNESAAKLATYLSSHSKVTQVYYPGLPNHKNHEIAKRQMKGFGGMLSFEMTGDYNSALTSMKKLSVARLAVSLGGPETILCFPCQTSHAKLTAEEREKVGIKDTLIRVSVGIEDIEDILKDFEQALA